MKTKQLLILTLVLIFGFSAFSQKGMQIEKLEKRQTVVDDYLAPQQEASIVNAEAYNYTNVSKSIEKIVMGKSGNIYGFHNDEATPLDYNPETNTLALIYRADVATYPEAQSSGTIMGISSYDMGDTWNEAVYLVNTDPAVAANRYPNGCIFNPEGNTDPSAAFMVGTGPSHVNSSWTKIWTASSQLEGDNANYIIYDADPAFLDLGGYFQGWNMTACEGDMVRTQYPKLTGGFSATELFITDYIGTYNNDQFEFEEGETTEFELELLSDGQLAWRGHWVGGDHATNYCWAKDGMTGYQWVMGRGEGIDDQGFIPVIFKTTDGGDNWDLLDYDLADFEDVFEPYIFETVDGEIAPQFEEARGAVDANGNLQMFAKCNAHYSLHIDSLTYSWVGDFGSLFNLEFGDEGLNKVFWVDSLRADYLADDDENAYGTVGWNHRLNITMDPDGQFAFFTWTDTYDEEYEVNCRPDIYGNYRRIDMDELGEESTVSFTNGSGVTDGFYFYFHASRMGFWEGEGMNFTVPCISVLTPPEYFADDDLQPATIHYVKGITFENVPTGINEQTMAGFDVSQNIPNPATGQTMVKFNLEKSSEINVVVTNIMGQKVFENNYGMFATGQNHVEFDVSQWDAGIYFYTISNGAQQVTRKMMVD